MAWNNPPIIVSGAEGTSAAAVGHPPFSHLAFVDAPLFNIRELDGESPLGVLLDSGISDFQEMSAEQILPLDTTLGNASLLFDTLDYPGIAVNSVTVRKPSFHYVEGVTQSIDSSLALYEDAAVYWIGSKHDGPDAQVPRNSETFWDRALSLGSATDEHNAVPAHLILSIITLANHFDLNKTNPWVSAYEDGSITLEIDVAETVSLAVDLGLDGSIDAALDVEDNPIMPIIARDVDDILRALDEWQDRRQ